MSIIPQDPVFFTDSTRKSSSSRRVCPQPTRTPGTADTTRLTGRGKMTHTAPELHTMTEEPIQRTIRDKFRECTALTVAHRLNTIIYSDRMPASPPTHRL
ncbi:multidrug resistance-associated protein 4-like isoform X2 [Sebastes umbrosus]|uniref:multidrug resistance-associated protein 4-like isoform X2 n=1 Tax=Sebastes umbrosus TaxID=72105 RepID=UPI00189EA9A6|nr:multidrug resistance-associated protein 4-like isoform X2 [Sebastes umbrosus]